MEDERKDIVFGAAEKFLRIHQELGMGGEISFSKTNIGYSAYVQVHGLKSRFRFSDHSCNTDFRVNEVAMPTSFNRSEVVALAKRHRAIFAEAAKTNARIADARAEILDTLKNTKGVSWADFKTNPAQKYVGLAYSHDGTATAFVAYHNGFRMKRDFFIGTTNQPTANGYLPIENLNESTLEMAMKNFKTQAVPPQATASA